MFCCLFSLSLHCQWHFYSCNMLPCSNRHNDINNDFTKSDQAQQNDWLHITGSLLVLSYIVFVCLMRSLRLRTQGLSFIKPLAFSLALNLHHCCCGGLGQHFFFLSCLVADWTLQWLTIAPWGTKWYYKTGCSRASWLACQFNLYILFILWLI